MKAVIISCFILFALARGGNSAVNAVECPDDQDHETSYVPSPVDCSKYYVCVHSNPIEMHCPEGLWFDSELNVCNYPGDVTCGADCQGPWIRPGSSVACYTTMHGNNGMKFNDAAEYCASLDGFLAEPRSDFETESIESILDPNVSYWIGLSDQEEEGSFRWLSDMSGPTYSNWQKNEPNNGGTSKSNQDCAQLWGKQEHRWDDQTCDRTSNIGNNWDYPITALCQK